MLASREAKHFFGLSRAEERDNAEKSPSPFLSEIQSKATIKSGKVSDAEFSEMLAQMRKWGEEYDHLRQEREESLNRSLRIHQYQYNHCRWLGCRQRLANP